MSRVPSTFTLYQLESAVPSKTINFVPWASEAILEYALSGPCRRFAPVDFTSATSTGVNVGVGEYMGVLVGVRLGVIVGEGEIVGVAVGVGVAV